MSTKTQKVTVQAQVPAASKNAKLNVQELQALQLNNEKPPMMKGNVDSSYEFPAHEADRVHVRTSKKENDPEKKEYVTSTRVHKLVPTVYERMSNPLNNSFAPYDKTELLHDPRSKAQQKAAGEPANEGEQKDPMQPLRGLPTLQDAQLRYEQVVGEKPAGTLEYADLIEAIRDKKGLNAEEEAELAAIKAV